MKRKLYIDPSAPTDGIYESEVFAGPAVRPAVQSLLPPGAEIERLYLSCHPDYFAKMSDGERDEFEIHHLDC